MKKIIAAFAILACLASAPSYATVFDAGTLTATPWNNGELAVTYPGSSTSFTDYINFKLTDPYTAIAASVTALNFSFGIVTVGTTISPIELYAGTYSSGTPTGTLATFSSPFSKTLTAGSYFLKIAGTTTSGSVGGGYTPSLNATVAAVPEPETWLMLGIGAALVGFQLRRKANAMESLSIAV